MLLNSWKNVIFLILSFKTYFLNGIKYYFNPQPGFGCKLEKNSCSAKNLPQLSCFFYLFQFFAWKTIKSIFRPAIVGVLPFQPYWVLVRNNNCLVLVWGACSRGLCGLEWDSNLRPKGLSLLEFETWGLGPLSHHNRLNISYISIKFFLKCK